MTISAVDSCVSNNKKLWSSDSLQPAVVVLLLPLLPLKLLMMKMILPLVLPADTFLAVYNVSVAIFRAACRQFSKQQCGPFSVPYTSSMNDNKLHPLPAVPLPLICAGSGPMVRRSVGCPSSSSVQKLLDLFSRLSATSRCMKEF